LLISWSLISSALGNLVYDANALFPKGSSANDEVVIVAQINGVQISETAT